MNPPRLMTVENISDNPDGSRTLFGTYLDDGEPVAYNVPAGGTVIKVTRQDADR